MLQVSAATRALFSAAMVTSQSIRWLDVESLCDTGSAQARERQLATSSRTFLCLYAAGRLVAVPAAQGWELLLAMLPKGMTLCVWVWIILLLRYGHVTPSTPKTVWPCLWKVQLGMGHFCCGSKSYAVLTGSQSVAMPLQPHAMRFGRYPSHALTEGLVVVVVQSIFFTCTQICMAGQAKSASFGLALVVAGHDF